MPYILYGLNLAAHLALVGLLIFLCFRTKSKGLILISAVLLMSEISGLIFQQVVKSDWWRWEPGKMRGEGILNMNALDLLLTVAMVHPLVVHSAILYDIVFLLIQQKRNGV